MGVRGRGREQWDREDPDFTAGSGPKGPQKRQSETGSC